MKKVVLKAYGKVNLGLDVVRRRDDGYHEVRMIMQTVGLFDRLELKKTSGDSVTLSANLRFLPVNEQNLVCQAIAAVSIQSKAAWKRIWKSVSLSPQAWRAEALTVPQH